MALLEGGAVKLCDEKGVFIGVLMVPTRVGNQLDYVQSHERTVQVYKSVPMSAADFSPAGDFLREMRADFFRIEPSYRMRGCFVLRMITPEEVSAVPGFAFLPSAEYMRRPAPEKIEERKPVDAGPHLTAAREFSA